MGGSSGCHMDWNVSILWFCIGLLLEQGRAGRGEMGSGDIYGGGRLTGRLGRRIRSLTTSFRSLPLLPLRCFLSTLVLWPLIPLRRLLNSLVSIGISGTAEWRISNARPLHFSNHTKLGPPAIVPFRTRQSLLIHHGIIHSPRPPTLSQGSPPEPVRQCTRSNT